MSTQQLDVDSADVIRLMLQFMKENNLNESWKKLSEETQVSLNTVDNLELFVADIHNGRWDNVLTQVNSMKMPQEKLFALYEHIFFEMLEIGEKDLAKEILRNTEPLQLLKSNQPDRYLKLEHLFKRPFFNATDAYDMGSSKERRRHEIADSLMHEVSVVPPSRLLSLLGQALRYQQLQGLLPKGGSFDLFRNARKTTKRDSEEKYPKRLAGQIKFPQESHPETLTFSPDGQSLVTGSIDGFVEVWDYDTCKLRKDLEYQAKEELMMHEDAVLCSAFSREGDLLATGSQEGKVKVWKVSTGVCLRKLAPAHPQGITSICFSRDGTQVLTTSFDHTARIHGLKSGRTLKEFRGHTSYVNSGIFTKDGQNVLTASSDGTVKLWDAKTSECLLSYRPGLVPGAITKELTVHTIQPMPNNPDHIFVCCKGPTAHLATAQGQIVRSFSSGKATGADFVCGTVSPQGKWLYCVGEDGIMYIFDAAGGQLESFVQVADGDGREIIAVVHHPHRNLVATISDRGQLKIWKP